MSWVASGWLGFGAGNDHAHGAVEKCAGSSKAQVSSGLLPVRAHRWDRLERALPAAFETDSWDIANGPK